MRTTESRFIPARKRLFAVTLFLLLVCILLTLYAFLIGPYSIKVEEITIHNSALSSVLEEITVVALSDLHMRGDKKLETRLVETVNALDPDLILITGDFTGLYDRVTVDLSALKSMKAALGIYGIPGNSDYSMKINGEYNEDFMEERLDNIRAQGVELLLDERRDLSIDGKILHIVGVAHGNSSDVRLEGLLVGVPRGKPIIVLSHFPQIISEAEKEGTSLVLAGHTHGGQMSLPLIGPLVVKSGFGRTYYRGHYRVLDTHLYVNRGVGTSFVHARFMCPPEVTVLKFVE
ncbi:metallophosphoesterase [Candidatus Hydrogenedentota bacterium]